MSLNLLRLASPRDILRIGVVSMSGFYYSPIFHWERPCYKKYPQDTLLSFRQLYTSLIKSPEHIVLVALDKYDPDEGKKSKAVIPPNNGAKIPAAGEEVVVGVACWRLEPGSKRIGQFQNEDGPYPDLPPNLDRDKNQTHCIRYAKFLEDIEKKYFGGHAIMEMVVVHPAYWSRGHGGNLLRWGMKLARTDSVKQGLTANKMGQDLYKELGWKNLKDIHMEGDEIAPQGVTVAVMEYDPTAR